MQGKPRLVFGRANVDFTAVRASDFQGDIETEAEA